MSLDLLQGASVQKMWVKEIEPFVGTADTKEKVPCDHLLLKPVQESVLINSH
jgi:hypothetical protein